MSFPFFVARRFFKNIGSDKGRASNPTIAIATAGVAVGLAVMLITMCIIMGFKAEITKKVEGFGGHIEILDPETFAAPDAHPVQADSALLQAIKRLPEVQSVSPIAQNMGILKTADDYTGVTLSGLPKNYDTTLLSEALVEGRLPDFKAEKENEILISRRQADDLNLKVGDKIFAYFFEETIKMRRFTICGIYQSNMPIFDKNYVLSTFATVRKLNHWEGCEASIIEIRLHDMGLLSTGMQDVQRIGQTYENTGHSDMGKPMSIVELYQQIFSWLHLLDFNMAVILILMLCVSGFTMISGLFILILERTQTIGVLKAMGATNTSIRRIFLNFAALITLRGLIIGDILAFVLIYVQQRWGFVHLNPANYYVETVPIAVHWEFVLALNVGTLLLTTLTLVAPSYMISRIQPAKAIRFE